MIPHTLVLKPGLVIHTVYNGCWYWGVARPMSTCRAICARKLAKFALTGT
jgi:hypothetical protein